MNESVLLQDRKKPVRGSLAKFLDLPSTRYGRLSKVDSASSSRVKKISRKRNLQRKLKSPKSPMVNPSDLSHTTAQSLLIRPLALYLERSLQPISVEGEEEEVVPISYRVSLPFALGLPLLQYLPLTLRLSQTSLCTLPVLPLSSEHRSKLITLVLPPSELSLVTTSTLLLLLPGSLILQQLPLAPKLKKRTTSPILPANQWRLPRDRNLNLRQQKIDSPRMLPASSLRWHNIHPPSLQHLARIVRCNLRILRIDE